MCVAFDISPLKLPFIDRYDDLNKSSEPDFTKMGKLSFSIVTVLNRVIAVDP